MQARRTLSKPFENRGFRASISAFLLCTGVAFADAPSSPPRVESIVRVIANPSEFDGEYVSIKGYLSVVGVNVYLFVDQGFAERNDTASAVFLGQVEGVYTIGVDQPIKYLSIPSEKTQTPKYRTVTGTLVLDRADATQLRFSQIDFVR